MPNLIRLVYVSESVTPMSPAELSAVLRTSQRNKTARGLTGVLLSAGGHFLQVLEGTAEAVTERLGVISADPRHTRIYRVLCEPTTDRLFGQWAMGLLDAAGSQAFDRRQFRALIERPNDATVVTNRTQVHKLLQNFRDQLSTARAA